MPDFVCSVIIKESNTLNVQYKVPYGEALKDFLSESWFLERKDLISSMYVEPAHTDGLFGRAYNPFIHHFKSIARVADNNTMSVAFELMQPPINTFISNATQDTYTREAKPTINYGGSHTLAAGIAADGVYKTYIQIDLKDIIELFNSSMNITSVRLLINKQEFTNGRIKIYEVYTKWYENYLLWLNIINRSEEPIFEVDAVGTVVSINIYDYVQNLIANRITSLNISIESTDFILFNSKESGLAPRIEVRYTDPEWVGHTDESFFSSHAVIKQFNHKNFYSSYRLRETSDFPGGGIKREPNLAESYAWLNRPFITCHAESAISSYLNASAFIKSSSDLKAAGVKNTALGNSRMFVAGRKDLFSTVIIPPDQATNNRIDKAFVLKGTWPSSAEIVRSSYFNCSVMVRAAYYSDIRSEAHAKQDPLCYVNIALHKNLISSVVVRSDVMPVDISSSAYLDKPWIYGSYSLRKSKDFIGTAFLRAYVNNDVISKITIPPPSDMPSNIIVRQYVYNDTMAETIIRQMGDNDRDAFATITSTLYGPEGQAIVKQFGIKELFVQAIIRRSDFGGIESFAELFKVRNIEAFVNVFQNKNIVGSATISQFDVYHSMWQAFVRGGYYRSPIVSFADVRGRYAHMNSKATIKTGARTWKPNVEGGLSFEDRKLPRVWIREHFIFE